MGFAERFLADTFNRPHHKIVDHHVYVICSDGDLMEGVSYEAGSLAGTNGLGKLIYFYDDNHITIDGTTSISFTEDRAARFEALGWHVQYGRRRQRPRRAARARSRPRRPRRAKPSIDHRALAHRLRRAEGGRHGEVARLAARRGRGRGDEEGARLGSRQALLRPRRGVRAHERRRARQRARDASGSRRFSTLVARRSRRAREVGRRVGRAHRRRGTLPEFEAGEEIATRDAGKKVMQAFKHAVPTMIGGAADLVESTKTEFEGGGLFSDQLVGPQHPVRHPRARDGLDRQRHRACTAAASSRTARRS